MGDSRVCSRPVVHLSEDPVEGSQASMQLIVTRLSARLVFDYTKVRYERIVSEYYSAPKTEE